MEKALQNKTEKENTLGTSSEAEKSSPKDRPTSKRRSRRRLPAW
jgi:hypothetical protein